MIIAILVVLGLCFGSFINALVWRLHKKKDWVRERSVCVHCGHVLASKDLIPVISWFMLGGKCRYCHKSISAQYPIVELSTALLFLISYIYWPFVFDNFGTTLFIFWLVFLIGLLALAVYDIKWFLLPDKIVYPLVILGLVQAIVILLFNPSLVQFATIVVSVLIGGGLFYILFQISDGKWIGGGDVKLGALLGLILANWQLMVLTIFTASLIGTCVSLPLLASGKLKRTTKIPFGPLLIVGAIIARLFGAALINWYTQKLSI